MPKRHPERCKNESKGQCVAANELKPRKFSSRILRKPDPETGFFNETTYWNTECNVCISAKRRGKPRTRKFIPFPFAEPEANRAWNELSGPNYSVYLPPEVYNALLAEEQATGIRVFHLLQDTIVRYLLMTTFEDLLWEQVSAEGTHTMPEWPPVQGEPLPPCPEGLVCKINSVKVRFRPPEFFEDLFFDPDLEFRKNISVSALLTQALFNRYNITSEDTDKARGYSFEPRHDRRVDQWTPFRGFRDGVGLGRIAGIPRGNFDKPIPEGYYTVDEENGVVNAYLGKSLEDIAETARIEDTDEEVQLLWDNAHEAVRAVLGDTPVWSSFPDNAQAGPAQRSGPARPMQNPDRPRHDDEVSIPRAVAQNLERIYRRNTAAWAEATRQDANAAFRLSQDMENRRTREEMIQLRMQQLHREES